MRDSGALTTLIRLIGLLALLSVDSPVVGDVQIFLPTEQERWLDTVASMGPTTHIGFTGFEQSTVVTDQYADLGLTIGGDYTTIFLNTPAFADGSGIQAFQTELLFDTSQHWFGVEFLGAISVELLMDDKQVFYIEWSNPFIAFISDQPFNRIIMRDPSDEIVAIDNIYFGAPVVPAPGTLLILIGGAGLAKRRRRPAGV